MTTRVVHETRVDLLGGSYYAFCRLRCGWSGPWRRWAWLARRDARRHLNAFRPRPRTALTAPLAGQHTTVEQEQGQ